MDDNIKYLTPKEQEAAKAREERDYMRKCMDEEKKRSSNFFFGFWGALSGALLGAILYACLRSNGVISSLMGLAIAYFASKCYDMTNVKRNINKLWCVVIACIIALPVGEFLGNVIATMADAENAQYLHVFVDYYLHNIGQFFIDSADSLFLGYVFAAMGSAKVFADIKAHDKKIEEMEEYLAEFEETE